MSDEREELAWNIFSIDNAAIPDKELRKDFPHEADYAFHIAEGLIETGYRKPRQVTTAEELDALPAKSVILDNEGTPWVGDGDKVQPWVSVFEAWKESRYILLPATVLHMGGSND